METPVCRVQKVTRAIKEILETQDRKGLRARKVPRATKETPEARDHKALRVRKDLRERPERRSLPSMP